MKTKIKMLLAMLMMLTGILGTKVSAANVLVWPVPASHTLSQGLHDGNAIDISAGAGSTVLAAKGGTVTKITYCTQTHHNYGDCNGFGTGLVILGDDGRAYQYAHMQGGSIPSNVYYGARVEAGQQIGKVGMTGYAYGPHLHFGISNTKNYWEAGSNPVNETYVPEPQVNIYIDSQSATNISETNAKLFGTLHKAAGYNCSVCGIYLGTSSSSMTKRNTESVGSASNNYRGGAGFDIWYDLTGELGIHLTPGTTYYYKVYAVINGKEYTGPVASFKTLGTAPSSSGNTASSNPVNIYIDSQSASNISETNAKLFGTLHKAAGYNCSVCGIYLGTSSSSMTKRNTESVGSASNNYRGGAGFDIWYDLTGELGIRLSPGTTYYYKIYAVVNGTEYTGPTASFRTAGSVPSAVIQPSSSGSSQSSGSQSGYSSNQNSGGQSGSSSSQSSGSQSSSPNQSSSYSNQGSQSGSSAVKKAKRSQNLFVYPGKTAVKYASIRKRAKTFRLVIIGAKGKIQIKSSSRYIKVKGMKVTIVKKTPRGTYKIKVTAAGNSTYKAASKTIRIVIR